MGCLAYVLYTNSLKDVLSYRVEYKTYADDTKIDAKVNNSEESLELQRAVEDFYSWTKSLDLKLSIEKCVVMHCGRKNENRDYFIDGKKLKCAPKAKDLGVVMSPDFNFREQTREVVGRAARQTNFILRCFVLSDADVYMKLFRTYVIPLLAYCALVWNPRFKKDKKLIQSVFDRFRRRISYRCKNDAGTIERLDTDGIFTEIGRKMFSHIRSDPKFCDLIFDCVKTNTRTSCTYRSKFVAKNEKVNNLFPWRVTRSYHV